MALVRQLRAHLDASAAPAGFSVSFRDAALQTALLIGGGREAVSGRRIGRMGGGVAGKEKREYGDSRSQGEGAEESQAGGENGKMRFQMGFEFARGEG